MPPKTQGLFCEHALGAIGDPQAVEPLITALQDGDANVREAAAAALDSLGWTPDGSQAAAAFWVARGDWEKAGGLGSIAVEPLIAALETQDRDTRRAAAAALAEIGDARAVEALMTMLKDEDQDARVWAARALGQLGDARAVEPLGATLKDKVQVVRNAALDALGKIGTPEAVDLLIGALDDRDPAWRQAVAEVLGQLDDPKAVEALIATLKHEDQDVRWAARGALVRIGAPAVQPLIVKLEDTDEGQLFRQNVAIALGRIGDPRAVESLITALDDGNYWVREKAARALAEIGDPRAVDPLIAKLKDRAEVRLGAAEALELLGWEPGEPELAARYRVAKRDWEHATSLGSVAVMPLLHAVRSGPRDLQREALSALGRIGAPAVKPLIAALSDSDLRHSADSALVAVGREDPSLLVPFLRQNSTVQVYRALIKLGDPSTERVLVAALKAHGTKEMATDYLNCGNDALEAAARQWAKDHGYTVLSWPSSGGGGPSWGRQ